MVIAWDGSFQNVRLCACVAIKLSHFNGPFSKEQLAAISLKLSINDQAGGIPMALPCGAVSKGTHSREPLPPVGWQDPEEAPSSPSSRSVAPGRSLRPVPTKGGRSRSSPAHATAPCCRRKGVETDAMPALTPLRGSGVCHTNAGTSSRGWGDVWL